MNRRTDTRKMGNSGTWNVYVVDDGECAASLLVDPERGQGTWLHLHSPIALNDEQLCGRDLYGFDAKCDWLPNGCFGGIDATTALGAHELFEKHGALTSVKHPEQPEVLWVALEDRLRAWIKELVDPRRHIKRCTACDGRGAIERARIAIVEPIGNCDGSGSLAYDPSAAGYPPCPGCRACK